MRGIIALGTVLVLALAGFSLPGWLVFLGTVGFAKGLVALGLIILMRGGLVSFGQGLFYCAGAYAAGLAMRYGGVGDAALLMLAGAAVAFALALVIAPLIAGYRGIFFATLTLALSMIAYGVLNKTYVLGGSDGINLRAPSFFGYQPGSAAAGNYALFLFTSAVVVIAAALARQHFDYMRGFLSLAVRDNDIRAEYLGA